MNTKHIVCDLDDVIVYPLSYKPEDTMKIVEVNLGSGLLAQDGFTLRTDIRLSFQEYEADVYEQFRLPNFVSHLFIIDVVANLGWEATSNYVCRKDQGAISSKL